MENILKLFLKEQKVDKVEVPEYDEELPSLEQIALYQSASYTKLANRHRNRRSNMLLEIKRKLKALEISKSHILLKRIQFLMLPFLLSLFPF